MSSAIRRNDIFRQSVGPSPCVIRIVAGFLLGAVGSIGLADAPAAPRPVQAGNFTLTSANLIRPDYGTNLWLEITNAGGGRVSGLIHNSAALVPYALFARQDLLWPAWTPAATVYGDPTSNVTAFGLPMLDRHDLFLWATSPRALRAIGSECVDTIALKRDGTVWAWGANDDGQLGNGQWTGSPVPAQVVGLSNIVAIAAPEDGSHTLALDAKGIVWSWGMGRDGQLGRNDGLYEDENLAAPVAGLSNVVAISCGSAHSVALKSDGTVWAWGFNQYGALGDGTQTERDDPQPVLGLTNAVAIASGSDHNFALCADGTVWGWGYNGDGELGTGSTDNQFQPVPVTGLTNVVALSGGGSQSLALLSDGTVRAWGYGGEGALGNGAWTNALAPVAVSGLSNIVAIASGGYHNLALGADGALYEWGEGIWDQLGNGVEDDFNTPFALDRVSNVVGMAAGECSSAVMTGDGTIYQWGRYGYVDSADWRQQVLPFTYHLYGSLDRDGDGLPDWFETQLGLAPNNPDSFDSGVNDYELIYLGFDPANPPQLQLGAWKFDTINWLGEAGQVPLTFTNLQSVPDWSGNAVHVGTNAPAWLAYREVETNLSRVINYNSLTVTQANWFMNLSLHNGATRFWFKPDWSSVRVGGTGPGTNAALIAVGSHAAGFAADYWGLEFSPDGNTLRFSSEGGGQQSLYCEAPVGFSSNQWYQVALTYNPNSSAIYTNGQAAATGTGVVEYPGPAARQDLGFNVGSTAAGDDQAFGVFDNLETFNYPLNPSEVSGDYNQFLTSATLQTSPVFVGTNTIALNFEGSPTVTAAVLVNDSNYDDAVSQTYNADPVTGALQAPVALGTNDGISIVRIGIWRGSHYQWTTRKVVLDTTPPIIVPAGDSITTNSPLLQLTGYATEALSSVSFDLINSRTTNFDQAGFITQSDGNTFAGVPSTNRFQCFDIMLAPGLNTITLRCADLAGNVSTNVYSYTLDTSSMTVPTLSVTWPPAGAVVSGHKITVKGHVNDPTASVTAQVVQNGFTNNFTGVVERDGTFWIDKVSLPGGTNSIHVSAMNVAGLAVTNAWVVQTNPVNIAVDPMSGDALTGDTATVSGTIDASGYNVTVNGIATTVWTNTDGSIHWQATGVPVNSGGVAEFRVQAVNAGDPETLATFAKPTFVRVRRYQEKLNYSWHSAYGANGFPGPAYYNLIQLQRDRDWCIGAGGSGSSDFYLYNNDWFSYGIIGPCHAEWEWLPAQSPPLGPWPPVIQPPWPPTVTNVTFSQTCNVYQPPSREDFGLFVYWQWQEYAPILPWEHADALTDIPSYATEPGAGGLYTYTAQYHFAKQSQTRLELVVGGRALPGQPTRVTLKATALAMSHPSGWDDPDAEPFPERIGDTAVPPADVHIANKACVDSGDSTNGFVTLMVPSGVDTLDVTPLVQTPSDSYSFDVVPVNCQMVVDNNRDGQITFDSSDATSADNPYRFWINDSQEQDDIVSGSDDQIPGSSSPNYNNSRVGGHSDLVNFFPIALNLGSVLQLLPPSDGYEYHLVQGDNATKFVYTTLTPADAFEYLTNDIYGFGRNTNEWSLYADTIQVTSAPGTILDTNWLAYLQDNGGTGVILVEGAATTARPLWLEVWRKGKLLGGTPLYLSISGVEQMYRHLNLRDGADAPANLPGPAYSGDAGKASNMGEPANYPDHLLDGKWLIFIHGYNVSAQQSRGWEAEMFKRFYWSHSRSKYVGVDWLGNPDGGGFIAHFLPNYYLAEMNAFATARTLAARVNALNGAKTIIAHSLGCGLAAVALNDYGLRVNHVCLLDAALAQECFDGDSDEDLADMAYSPWTLASNPSMPNYPKSLWAADWHKQFQGGGDMRQTLTWENRFTNGISIIYNFYSSTEDVLGAIAGTPTQAILNNIVTLNGMGTYAWVTQEKSKGNFVNLFGVNLVGSDYGGWGFNIFDGYLTNYPTWYEVVLPCNCSRRIKMPDEIGSVTQDLLDGSQFNPLFKTGWGAYDANNPSNAVVETDAQYFTGPSWILGLYQSASGSTIAADPAKNTQLLAEAIPALSLPVGANLTTSFGNKNVNMPEQFADAVHWPVDRGINLASGIPNWHHGDIDQVAYHYIYKLYDQLASISNQ